MYLLEFPEEILNKKLQNKRITRGILEKYNTQNFRHISHTGF